MVETKGTGQKKEKKGVGETQEKKGVWDYYEFNTKDFIKSFVGVTKTVLVKPSDFYQRMPVTGGYPLPLIFLAVCVGVSVILGAIIFGGDLYQIIKLFVVYMLFTFIGAGILHFIAQQFFEGKGSYEGTYRVVAYAGAVYLLLWIPVVQIFAVFYGFYLQIVGLEKVHKLTTGQAVVTVLIALVVYLIISLIVGGAFLGIRY